MGRVSLERDLPVLSSCLDWPFDAALIADKDLPFGPPLQPLRDEARNNSLRLRGGGAPELPTVAVDRLMYSCGGT